MVTGSDLLTVLPKHFLPSTGISDEFTVVDLPFDVPPVRVDMVWHRRAQTVSAQQWLRAAVSAAAKGAVAAVHA